MRFNNKHSFLFNQPLAQFFKFFLAKNNTKVRDWNIILINMIAMFLWFVVICNITHDQLMIV